MTNDEPTLVGGRYQLDELLGRGGMAEVRKGTDTRLGRVVAVKRLRTDLASDATFQARFRREAQSSASLNHPAIVAVYDTGEEMSPDGVAQPYIVMEYVAGRTLRDILREGRKILPERALEITSGVLSALDYSHRAGIIHRDIKPANVMLTPGGDVKVMDFGIARAVSDASSTMTQTAAVVGTAQYLSPEQARGETVDSRSDVYSTGCLLYELLTGRPPFVGESPVAVAYQHVREPAVPPSSIDPDLPPEVDAIVMKSLAKRLDERYQSAAAMRSDIERYLLGRPVQAPAVAATAAAADVANPTSVIPATASQPVVPAATSHREEEKPDRTGLWIALGVLLLALIGAAIWLIPKMGDDPTPQKAVPSVVGETEEDAVQILQDEGFQTRVETQTHDEIETGHVITTDPRPNVLADEGSLITIIVSTGKPAVAIPDLVGLSSQDARDKLVSLGLTPKEEPDPDSDAPKDEVTRQTPEFGSDDVAEGTTVTYYVSQGPQTIPENLVGRTEEEATKILRDMGWEVNVLESDNTIEPKGTVIQVPEAGTEMERGRTVTIVVSTYEEPTEEPTPDDPPTSDDPPPDPEDPDPLDPLNP
ncbi:Stk1 family PASTA domain-containing Ser/Thr kinase [Nocardioides sp. AE5]|uniref:Stk1 family PASTA domain-containing Ser/Thr kinase n=1 Tax=Nocardioides sp. AE5 TaxID=2962573 RepID=UPI00288256B8|nr:Stk1 family PASTA domain-containing Ser/Thr kinase [Nocardioides sp. AE5]MDT0202387.1 Stk1 family PASTA domain-containing Ser/Thr kinase [Nocardioides sp. AE5]